MNLHRLGVVLVLFILATGSDAPAGTPESILDARPCGPDSVTGPLRWLIPQGAFGADFRPACRAHDACYDTPFANRSQCDQQFLNGMLQACDHSTHPVLCRRKARLMHRVTSRHGGSSFQSAQAVAMRTVAATAR
jgi:hypothetical protein